MCVQGITGGDGKEEMPATSAATGMAKGERSRSYERPRLLAGVCTKLFAALRPVSPKHRRAVPPRTAASPGSLEFGKAPRAAGLTALTGLDPVGQPKALFVCLSNMRHSRRYCFMKYLLFLITTQGFPERWRWLADIHVVSHCLLLFLILSFVQ